MKGLFVKDYRLLLGRKRFFLIVIVWAAVMCFTMDDFGFVAAWLCMIGSIFSLSTLNYDEYDNSMPFLMSLPVTPKQYALEKYAFGAVCGVTGWLLAVAVRVVYLLVRKTPSIIGEEIVSVLLYLPLMLLLLSLSLPVELKWGGEKGRLYLLLIGGIVFVAAFLATKLLPGTQSLEASAQEAGPGLLTAVLFGVAAAALAFSLLLSIRIISRKEY